MQFTCNSKVSLLWINISDTYATIKATWKTKTKNPYCCFRQIWNHSIIFRIATAISERQNTTEFYWVYNLVNNTKLLGSRPLLPVAVAFCMISSRKTPGNPWGKSSCGPHQNPVSNTMLAYSGELYLAVPCECNGESTPRAVGRPRAAVTVPGGRRGAVQCTQHSTVYNVPAAI